MKKSFATICLALLLIMSTGVNVFAASGINADEQRVLDALSQSVTTQAGVSLTLPSRYISQAKTFMLKDGVDLTASQCDQIIAKTNEAVALIAATSATRLLEIPLDVQSKFVEQAKGAASVIGLTLSYNATTRESTVTDASGSIVATSGSTVKQTGTDFSSTFLIGGLLAVLILASGVYAKKSNLFVRNNVDSCNE